MTDVDAPTVAAMQRPRAKRGVAIAAVLATLAAAMVIVVTAVRHVDHRYGPVAGGNTGGAYDTSDFRSETNDDSGPMVIDGPAGTRATMFSMLTNDGNHDVRVTAVERNDAVSDVLWSVYRTNSSNLGESTPWQHFPATVPAHGQIRLLQVLHQPTCPARRTVGGGSYLSTYLEVHWESLLHDHVTEIDGPDYPQVHLC